ncbi:MAG: lipopolysaccharide heptosyltransferase II [Phycisphaerae bacterium]|nr:lipopolysaccharide heptosyltransferase II [Phycisphaerae bacterium]
MIKPSSLGDIVHALPVLHGLRRRFPQARIDWLVAKSCAGLLAGHPDIAELVIFDRRRFGRLGRSLEAGVEFHRFLRMLRRRGYDLAIDLQGLFRSGFLALASGAPVRIGFADARELSWVFYTHRISVPADVVHAAEKNYAVAHLLGFSDVDMTFDLALGEAERCNGARMLQAAGLADGARFAAVLPGARWETKRWFPERFAEVVDELASEHHLTSVLMGGPDERRACESIAGRCRCQPINLAGRTGLRELAAILAQAAVVLCHDSAPMHLAAALGVPMVCILGPTNPARTGPYRTDATILQAGLPCVPCYLRKLSHCRFNHECMHTISPTEVTGAIASILQKQP